MVKPFKITKNKSVKGGNNMLYSYKYLKNHHIEIVHKNIYVFFRLLKIKNKNDFSLELLNDNFLRAIKECDKLMELINAFVNKYYDLTQDEQKMIYIAFVKNNMIRKVCSGEVYPVLADDICEDIRSETTVLFKYLYNDFLMTKSCEKLCGTNLYKYFQDFLKVNNTAYFCPFCGLMQLTTQGEQYRDDYDHFLPKSKYLFNSVNFKNLTPMCHICNSKVKLDQSMVLNGDSRRKVLYPYNNKIHIGDVSVKLHYGMDYSLEVDINYPCDLHEEMESWMDIFDIKERYVSTIKINRMLWIEMIQKKYKIENQKYKKYSKNNQDLDPSNFMKDYIKEIEEIIDSDKSFLKKAFVEFLLTNNELKNNFINSMETK